MSEYFAEPKSSGGRVKVELDLPNYATKADLKNVAGVDTSKFSKKIDLGSLISNVDKLDIDLIRSKIKNIEDKIPNITNLTTKTTLNAKINEVVGEIPSITNLAKTAALNAKINEVKDKIPNITNLASTTALTAVENKHLMLVI